MIKINLALTLLLALHGLVNAQNNFSNDPWEAKFVTEDVDRFWVAFDKVGKTEINPFVEYVENGTPGVKGFIPYRIINADSLYAKVLKRKTDYLKCKDVLHDLDTQKKKIRAIYAALKYWYPDAVFPPVYFVVGRFNTAGTVSEDGIILGTEMMQNLDGLPGLVAHELIHFQQKAEGPDNILKQSILEGSADFVGELISGKNVNAPAFLYGEKNEAKLCKEFVLVMDNEDSYVDWLYGTSGKDDRPNDLGYWVGYKISESYFNKQDDKRAAIKNILTFKDPEEFLKQSGYLNNAIEEVAKMSDKEKEDLLRVYSIESYEITFLVTVPNKTDDVYITGNQEELANWDAKKLMLEKVSDYERKIKLKVHTPAQFKFTRGSWDSEAQVEGYDSMPNLRVMTDKAETVNYKIVGWKDRK